MAGIKAFTKKELDSSQLKTTPAQNLWYEFEFDQVQCVLSEIGLVSQIALYVQFL